MKAIVDECKKYYAENPYYGKKEMVEAFLGLDGSETIVKLIIYHAKNHDEYRSTSRTIYAYVEVSDENINNSHSGIAKIVKNINFHQSSSIAYEVFKAAGIEFDENIRNTTDRTIERAIESLLSYYGCENPNVTRVSNC